MYTLFQTVVTCLQAVEGRRVGKTTIKVQTSGISIVWAVKIHIFGQQDD